MNRIFTTLAIISFAAIFAVPPASAGQPPNLPVRPRRPIPCERKQHLLGASVP